MTLLQAIFAFIIIALCAEGITADRIRIPKNHLFAWNNKFGQFLNNDRDDKLTVYINSYFDAALETISSWLVNNKMDPFVTPDMHQEFQKKVGPVTWHGSLDLTQGLTTGISSVKRNSAAILTYKPQLLNIFIPITFNSLDMKFNYDAHFMDLKKNGSIEACVHDLELHINILIDTSTTDVILNRFQISHAGHMKIRFSGNKASDWFANFIADVATSLFHESLRHSIEIDARNLIQNELKKMNGWDRME